MSEQKRLVGNVTKNDVNTRVGNTYVADPIKLLGGMLSLGLGSDEDNTLTYLNSNNLEDTNKYKTQLKKQEAQLNKQEAQLKKEQKAIQKQQQEIKQLKEALKPQKTSLTKINVKTQNPIKFTPNKNTDEQLFKLHKKNNSEARQRRADILYGTDEEYNNKYNLKQTAEETSTTKSNFKEQPIIEYEAQTPLQVEISNSEKMFYNNETLADMPLGTSLKNHNGEVDLTNIDIQKTDLPKTTFEMYVCVNEFNNNYDLTKEELTRIDYLKKQEIDVKGLGTITVGELIPNLEECVQEQKILYLSSGGCSLKATTRKKEIKWAKIPYDIKLIAEVLGAYVWALITIGSNPLSRTMKTLKEKKWKELTKSIFSDIYSDFKKSTSISYFCRANNVPYIKDMLLNYVNGSIFGEKLLGFILPDTAGLLKLNKADSDLNTNYTKDAQIFDSIYKLPEKYREFVKNKAKGENLKSIVFNSNSGLSQRISKSEIMLDLITNEEEIEKILKNNGNTGIIFATNKNLYYAINKADICNLKRDEEGNISGDLIDISDYDNSKQKLIQAAKQLQDSGEFVPRVIIAHFVISKETQEKYKEQLKEKESPNNKEGMPNETKKHTK